MLNLKDCICNYCGYGTFTTWRTDIKANCPHCGSANVTRRPTQYALDLAMVTPAKPDSSLEIIPAGEVDTQPS